VPTPSGHTATTTPEAGEDGTSAPGAAGVQTQHQSSAPEEAAASDALSARDVYLLTTTETGGRVAVPGLALTVDQLGLTVFKPDGTVAAVLAWEQLTGLAAAARTRTPAGRDAVVMEASTTSKRTHRFVVPTEDPAAFEAALAELASRRQQRRRTSPVLVGILLAVIGAAVAVLILAGIGTVKF